MNRLHKNVIHISQSCEKKKKNRSYSIVLLIISDLFQVKKKKIETKNIEIKLSWFGLAGQWFYSNINSVG